MLCNIPIGSVAKKKLASNWFKLLQNIICSDIEKLENNKVKFSSKTWVRNKKKNEVGGEFKMRKRDTILGTYFYFIISLEILIQF